MNAAMRLPRRQADDAHTVTGGPAPVPILVVDDNAAKRLGLKAVLLPLGYSIVEADSGLAALRCIMAHDFAVILLDVRMPIMDGFETAALIRQRRQSEMTPIIFITAHGKDEIVNTDLYAEGAVDFIFAPVPPDELRAKVSVFANLFTKAEELARRAREVQTSADQLRLLTDAAPIGIFQTDDQNRYVTTNPRWTEITGISADKAVGRKWDTIMGSEERARLIAELPGGYGAELSHRFEIRVPGATPRMALVTSRSIPDGDGGIAGWVGTLADVTAEVGAEAAMSDARDKATEASRLKSDFLANMSHEIRTPMNGVIGMTDLLLETDLDARAARLRADGAQLGGGPAHHHQRHPRLLEDRGRASSRSRTSSSTCAPSSTTSWTSWRARRRARGSSWSRSSRARSPRWSVGDPGRVRQVLTNLIGNAIKFTQSGEIVVRVTEAEAGIAGGDTMVRFEVSDTGDGIGPEKLDQVFQPFVQADTSTSRRYGGTGLGLAISSQLIALMGGDCGVWSRLDVGSNFWFTISVDAVAGQVRDELLSPDAGLAGVTALIVDDNAAQRSVLSEYLTDWGMIVSTADSGPAALATLRAAAAEGRPFAVAVLDRKMPGMDGLALKDAIGEDPALSPPDGDGDGPAVGARPRDRRRFRDRGIAVQAGPSQSYSGPVCASPSVGLRMSLRTT